VEKMLPVCDENNVVLGCMPKSEVHARGLWHRGAHLWITDGHGNVLQQFRDPGKKILPGVWDIAVAGHVSAIVTPQEVPFADHVFTVETPEETAIKEAFEELGLVVSQTDFQPAGGTLENSITITDMYIEANGWQHRVFDYNFVMRRELDLDALQLEQGHVADVRWYPLDQLEADLRDPSTAAQHAYRPVENSKLYAMVIEAMRQL
jgi:isopentenyldiphosphate isomerase